MSLLKTSQNNFNSLGTLRPLLSAEHLSLIFSTSLNIKMSYRQALSMIQMFSCMLSMIPILSMIQMLWYQ